MPNSIRSAVAPRPARAVVDADGGRRADLAAIHIGKKALGWDDDEYRRLLWTVCQVRSSADLDFSGRKRFLDHMRRCGWAGSASKVPERRTTTVWSPQQRLVWSRWQQLADAGLVTSRGRKALDTWIKRNVPTAVDALEFLNNPQISLVLDMQKRWLARAPAKAS